jgi:hypothetical protein
MHEIACHQDHNVDDFRPAATAAECHRGFDITNASQITALSTLLRSSHEVLDTWLSVDVECARTLANLYIVWCAYAVVILIKLYWLFNKAESNECSLLFADLKAEHYVDAMLDRLGQMSAEGKSPCAAAFGFVFTKLKIWHLHRSGQLPNDDPSVVRVGQQPLSSVFQQDPVQIFQTAKRMQVVPKVGPAGSTAGFPQSQAMSDIGKFPAAMLPGSQWNTMTPERFPPTQHGGQNLNAAYDAANYGKTNWDQFNFSAEEMDMFDVYMNNSGWMGYLL